MSTEADELMVLLSKFAVNKVKPAPKVLERVIAELARLQHSVKQAQDRIAKLEKEVAGVPPKPTAASSFRESAEDRVARDLRARFPLTPGSQYHRAYCCRCREPMRIARDKCAEIMTGRTQLYCESCSPPLPTSKAVVLTPRQLAKLGNSS